MLKTIEKSINSTFVQQMIPTGIEVCQKQLFYLIQKMQNVEINEKLAGKYIPEISEILKDMSKEEVISRFVSLEFNRFLDYYKNSVDLNTQVKKDDGFGDGREKRRSGK